MFIPLKNLIPQALRRNKIAPQVEATLVLKEFNKIAQAVWGEKFNQYAKALYLKDKVLTVAVLSSIMVTEVRLNKNNLINSINTTFGYPAVKDIRLII